MWNYRLATNADSEMFTKWTAENPQISLEECVAGNGKNHPTVLYCVAEKDGVPIAFCPIYLSGVLAYVGLNPDSRAAEKVQALDGLKLFIEALLVQYGIRDLWTPYAENDGVAQWAGKRGFVLNTQPRLWLDLNKEMAEVPEVPVCE